MAEIKTYSDDELEFAENQLKVLSRVLDDGNAKAIQIAIGCIERERYNNAEPDEWMEHHIRVEGYARIYYQHTCVPQLVENPYRFCPFCGKKMKSKDMT